MLIKGTNKRSMLLEIVMIINLLVLLKNREIRYISTAKMENNYYGPSIQF